MVSFKAVERICGIIVFAIAFATYALTVAPTASFWDSGEFISAAYKLQIPHAPGAPFYTLVGRIFSLVAGDNPEHVAFWVNMVSVLSSSFTILFLFWSLILLIRKLVSPDENSKGKNGSLLILGSSLIGALAYTFSDSFWFSAVEAEVYALSSLFTAVVFWAILKWETIPRESNRHKMLIFIAFLIGLSVGVHPLNLLTIPCLALVIYFKKKTYSTKGIFLTLIGSALLILLLMFVLRINLLNLATAIEVFSVNVLNLPFNTGAICFLVLLTGGLIYVIWYSQKHGKVMLNTGALCFVFILVGYSSYVAVGIRASYEPPLNYSNPQNLINLASYLNMEDYGTRPLLRGPYYYSKIIGQTKGNPTYIKGEDRYEIKKFSIENEYDPAQTTILPRLYSDRPGHPEAYAKWLNLKKGEIPDFSDNLSFLVNYQFLHMYFRYFMWNFSGRESDVQQAGWVGLWDAGQNLPASITSNKARNNFLMLPLLLGLLGAVYSYKRNKSEFLVILTLFFITGLGLVLYLNVPPLEPRERDYIYVGSFFAFCIWISMGAFAIADFVSRWKSIKQWGPAVALVGCLSVPLIMLSEGWDDHDRSDRYYAVDSAKNFLATCAPNAILFTGGDNDTYPLWYAQEVEGFRTDVRVIVTTLFNVDWYVNQLMQQDYQSDPLPLQLTSSHYQQGGLNDYIPVVENPNLKGQPIHVGQYLNLVGENHPAIQMPTTVLGEINTLPSKILFLPVNPTNPMLKVGIPKGMEDKVSENMFIKVKDHALYKGDLLILDLLVNNHWERPIYFTPGALQNLNLDIEDYLVNEGICYRLLPLQNDNKDERLVNTEAMYANLMKKYRFRELDNKEVHYSAFYKNQLMLPRTSFNTLAKALIDQNKFKKAKEVLKRSIAIIPDDTIPYDVTTLNTVALFFKVGEAHRAKAIADVMVERIDDNLNYYLNSKGDTINEVKRNFGMLNYLAQIMKQAEQTKQEERYLKIFNHHYLRYEHLM